ncbi:MAG: T9SS type A sorting domain-containing protein [Gemmatimonadetes bacterium]|nr:T9SS type A sorting domain-containing protein [Gemmatimonadota bacterium]
MKTKIALAVVALLVIQADAQTYFEPMGRDRIDLPTLSNGVRTIAWGDYDNDGWPDILYGAGFSSELALLHNEGGTGFSDRTFTLKAQFGRQPAGGGVSFADIDNDGDLDALVPKGMFFTMMASRNVLLRNDAGVFSDGGVEAGLTGSLPTDNAIWLDYDRDGLIDLYSGNLATALPPVPTILNQLYRNLGNGRFTGAAAAAGIEVGFADAGFGSNGGMVACDFTNDGWPDLYVGVFNLPNRLFIGDGEGGFVDASTEQIRDEGQAFGVAVGDINNDGKMDIFQAAGGGNLYGGDDFRSLLLLNAGSGEFFDITGAAGLADLVQNNLLGPGLADIDNDGDLDLMIGLPPALYLNNGQGQFVDATAQSGIPPDYRVVIGFADYDLDGFIDVLVEGQPYHNTGNTNHWLTVDPVGVQSNRAGIGVRVSARAGDLGQVREVTGGMGYAQHELVAHFGLGTRSLVDSLEIRWPSGQVDLLLDVPIDQRIRVIEGRADYTVVRPSTWTNNLPSQVVNGTSLQIQADVRPALFDAASRVVQVTADLSQVGGPADLPLTSGEDGYRLDAALQVEAASGWKVVQITIDQETSIGPLVTSLTKSIDVLPEVQPGELRVYGNAQGGSWHSVTPAFLEPVPGLTDVTHQGESVTALQVSGEGSFTWEGELQLDEAIDSGGYEALRLAVHTADVQMPWWDNPHIGLMLNRTAARYHEFGERYREEIDFSSNDWQTVTIPLERFSLSGPIEQISIFGDVLGPLYIGAIDLIPADPSTAIVEEKVAAGAHGFELNQNFPNPFNSATVIRFALPATDQIDLAVYNMTGQRVATLARGLREAGVYELNWDGTDGRGRAMATGVYFYQLRTGTRVERQRMLLLR